MMAFIGARNKMDLLRAAAFGYNIVIITGNFQYFLVNIWIFFSFLLSVLTKFDPKFDQRQNSLFNC